MYTYTNGKTTITTACEIAGGGWVPVSKAVKSEQDTRTEQVKEPKNTTKRKKE